MFGPTGGRPRTVQHIALGAERDGTAAGSVGFSDLDLGIAEKLWDPAVASPASFRTCRPAANYGRGV